VITSTCWSRGLRIGFMAVAPNAAIPDNGRARPFPDRRSRFDRHDRRVFARG